jgi:hypothetical protein
MFLLVVLSLQTPALEIQKPAAPAEPALERIRRELERPVTVQVEIRTDPMIRVYVEEEVLRSAPPWLDTASPPAYARPRQGTYHDEFQKTVVPEDFRAATLHPIGLDSNYLVPIVDKAITSVRRSLRSRAEARARARIQQELKELAAARKAAAEERR